MEAVVTHQFAEDCSSKVESLYYLTACITSLSAFLGLAFSIYAIKNSDNQEKTNALYMFARSMAILFISVIPFFQRSDVLLRIITSSMLIIQVIDCIVGIYIKNRMRTVGPSIMAVLHAICLLI